MSRPPINPEKTAAGIAVDPQTLERVIPESRRPDGSIRKQIKVRPGFTPQEDVKRFRGTRQAQMDANTLPKGHIIGWAPPSSAAQPSKPMGKSAKKNAKRKEKREEKRVDVIRDNWDDDDDDEEGNDLALETSQGITIETGDAVKAGTSLSEYNTNKSNRATGSPNSRSAEQLTLDLEKLDVN